MVSVGFFQQTAFFGQSYNLSTNCFILIPLKTERKYVASRFDNESWTFLLSKSNVNKPVMGNGALHDEAVASSIKWTMRCSQLHNDEAAFRGDILRRSPVS